MRYIKKALGVVLLVSVVLLFGAIGECENGGNLMLCTARMLFSAACGAAALFALGAIDQKERNE